MKAVKTHVGRCDTCGEPAAYAQLLAGGGTFRFFEEHAPLLVKKQAEATEASEKNKKKSGQARSNWTRRKRSGQRQLKMKSGAFAWDTIAFNPNFCIHCL